MKRARSIFASAAIFVLAALLQGCGGGEQHPLNTITTKSDFARWITNLFVEITVLDLLVLAAVLITFILAIFFFSTRVGNPAPPSTTTSDLRVEIAYTLIPALIIIAILVPTVRTIFRSQPYLPPKGSLQIEVVAHQWWWDFSYMDSSHINTANELHIPTGVPIRLNLESNDVIHSFWVPQLGGKRDVVPGQANELTFTASVPGEYLGECAEFCGESHANMRFRVFVQTPEQFAAWEKAQEAPPGTIPASETAAAEGQKVFENSPCTTCHTISGVSKGYIGPNLTHFGSRTTMAGGIEQNDPHNVAEWITDPNQVKPGVYMPALGLRGTQLNDLVAYLESLK